jgi:hypothetical protein
MTAPFQGSLWVGKDIPSPLCPLSIAAAPIGTYCGVDYKPSQGNLAIFHCFAASGSAAGSVSARADIDVCVVRFLFFGVFCFGHGLGACKHQPRWERE